MLQFGVRQRIAFARVGFVIAFAWMSASGLAQQPSPHAIDIPPWFATTFLDFREDIDEAAREGKRLLVYFGQDGCPYCKKLMTTNFSQRAIVDKTRSHFVAIAINMWGDRELRWLDGRTTTEKGLAALLKVQFTPTILIFDESGNVVVRLDGYYPPQRFEAVLEYAARKLEKGQTLGEYLRRAAKEPAAAKLHDQPFIMTPPYDLRRKADSRPLAVLFETVDCSPCDEMHREGFRRSEVLAQVRRVDVARFALASPTPLTTPDGRAVTAEAWARELGVTFTPTVVFFDSAGKEVFRVGAYLRPFHLAASFAYVADQAYRTEPSFQRFIQARAERMRARGERVDLWE
jgi:thioredoxin-related protein